MSTGPSSPKRPSRYLRERYVTHNAARGADFVFGGEGRVRMIKRLLPDRIESALDLGCRDGALTADLGLNSSHVIGVDIDDQALQRALQKDVLSPCQANLWEELPFRTSSFDLVIAGEILEHLPFPDKLLVEIDRVLRPGGAVVGSVPNAFRLKNRLLFLMGHPYERDPTHLRQFSVPILRQLLEKRFSGVEVTPCVGRLAAFAPRLMANDLVWRGIARHPRS